jgi:hypothetical protein
MLCSSGLEALRADAEDSVMALSSVLWSPYCSDFRPEVENWARLLQDLGREQAYIPNIALHA